jgi:hypothetical protein
MFSIKEFKNMDFETFKKLIQANQMLTCDNWKSMKYLKQENSEIKIFNVKNQILENTDLNIFQQMSNWSIYDPLFEFKKQAELKIGKILQSYS